MLGMDANRANGGRTVVNGSSEDPKNGNAESDKENMRIPDSLSYRGLTREEHREMLEHADMECTRHSRLAIHEVLVAVDLNEVEQELPDHQQSLVLRDARNTAASGSYGDVTSPMSPSWNLVTMPLATNTKATVRMKREDPSKTEQLVKCVSLPSLKASNMTQMNFTMRPSRRSHDF
ncbi:unnamed protein product [Durusdinium trenchii]|uniref:Uncharacterized protein n=1 Tax=Durusdinium trenchii TaxID=1381693 RepID=A0ABP0PV17_9DINO